MSQLSQLGQREFTGEIVVGEVEASEAAEVGDSGREFAGEVVVGEVDMLEVGPSGEIGSDREVVMVEAEVAELSELGQNLD